MRVVLLLCLGTHGDGWGSPPTQQGQSLRSPSSPRALMLSYMMQVLERLRDSATRRQCDSKCSPPPGEPRVSLPMGFTPRALCVLWGGTTAAGETDQGGPPAPSSRGWG